MNICSYIMLTVQIFNYTTVLYFYNIIDTCIKQSKQSQNMADLSAGYDHKQETIRSNKFTEMLLGLCFSS